MNTNMKCRIASLYIAKTIFQLMSELDNQVAIDLNIYSLDLTRRRMVNHLSVQVGAKIKSFVRRAIPSFLPQ